MEIFGLNGQEFAAAGIVVILVGFVLVIGICVWAWGDSGYDSGYGGPGPSEEEAGRLHRISEEGRRWRDVYDDDEWEDHDKIWIQS